jgi:hypothetical protein
VTLSNKVELLDGDYSLEFMVSLTKENIVYAGD